MTTRTRAFLGLARSLAIVAAWAAAPASRAGAQEPFPGLDAYITKGMADWKIPGLALAIVRNDSVLYTKGYGVLKAGSPAPVDDRTLFEIGSSSKSFTATLVAMLVSDGKVRWDDRLSTYLPDFRLYDPVASAEVTLRDALSHRSGLPRAELSWMYAAVSRSELLRRMRFLKPAAPFRSRWIYQNVMLLAAGEAAGKAAGTTWDELLQKRIFEPLGMTSSLPVARDPERIAALATPHVLIRDSVSGLGRLNMDNIAPAGAIASTARDMAQWLRFQLGDGVYAGKRLVSSAALRETHTPQMLMGAGGGGGGGGADSITRFSTYGMGWMVQDYRRQLLWQHGGATDGMSTAMGMLPEQKFGVVVLSNLHGAQLPDLLMRWLFDRQLGVTPARDWSAEALARSAAQRRRADSTERAQTAQRTPGAKPPLPLAAYAGSYADSLYGEATVSLEGDQLTMRRGGWNAPLEYWSGNIFRWGRLQSAALPTLFVKFDTTPDGRVSTLLFGIQADTAYLGRKSAAGSRAAGAP